MDMEFVKKVMGRANKGMKKDSGHDEGSPSPLALIPAPHYPSMPRYPPSGLTSSPLCELNLKVSGMECGACAGSIEKSVKRLPGIEDATVSVLQNRAQVIYNPSFIHVSKPHIISLFLCDLSLSLSMQTLVNDKILIGFLSTLEWHFLCSFGCTIWLHMIL